jgi:DNA-binding SARP family transcriptional activator/WD40 repeat protein
VPDRHRSGISRVSAALTRSVTGVDGLVVEIRVLGPLTVDGSASGLSPRDRAVLAALVVGGEEALSVDQLGEAVWGDRLPASWRKVLHGCVARLRRTLGAAAIATVPNGYRIAVGADDVDARRFERLVRRARELLAVGEADRALFVLAEASALWRGRALSDVDGWEPGRIEAGRLDELRLDAEELRMEAALRAGRHLEVLAEALARVAEAPLRERRWALLALAQYQAGRQGEALASLRRARTVLRNELGLDPGPDLARVEHAILHQDPSLPIAQGLPAPSTGCPYRGLLPYGVSDAEAFFGRDADVAACLRRLAKVGVLAVVGPSGSGKSSLVRAGVVAALRREGRPVAVVTPGHHPMDSLAAVPASGRNRVLVVDQCEEAFILCEDGTERTRFLAALADRADRADGGPLVLVIRADRLGELSAEPRLARAVEGGLYLLTPMSEPDLRAAVEGPAAQAGLLVEPGLVDLLVRDAEGEPGALPLLSHALRQTWQGREGRTLTVTAYRATGGIRGAVANTAEELYNGLPADQRPMLHRMLLRLVVQTPDGAPSRAPVPRRQVAAGPEQESMIERLVAARLITAGEGVVELAHESLVRAWPRLRSWLDEDADGQRIRRHLSVAADAWDGMGRPDSEVYRGTRLVQALEWREHSGPDLTPTEESFLDAAGTLAAAEKTRAVEQVLQQARANRRLRALLAASLALLLVAGGAGVVAARQARSATRAATAADARRIGSQAVVTAQIDKALVLAVQGVRLDDSADTRGSLLATLNRARQLLRVVATPGRVPRDLRLSTDGRRLAVLDGQRMGTYDTASLQGAWAADDARVAFPSGRTAIRPDGRQAAILSTVGLGQWSFRLVSPTGEYALPRLLPKAPETGGIGYSPDGRLLAVGHGHLGVADRRLGWTGVQIWDVAASTRQPGYLPHYLEVPWLPHTVRFSPDGRLLYVGTGGAPLARPSADHLVVFDVRSGDQVRRVDIPGPLLDISPDGRLLAVADAPPEARPNSGARARQGDVVLADAVTGAQRLRLPGDGAGPVSRILFAPDGRSLAAVTAGNAVTVWSLPGGSRVEELHGHANGMLDIAFGLDGATLYTAGEEGAILVWDLRGDRRFVRREATIASPGLGGSEVAISPDGRSAALNRLETSPDGGLRGWLAVADLRTGRAGAWVDTSHGRFTGPVWHPDGDRFATTGYDGMVRSWDPVAGRALVAEQVSHTGVPGASYSHDGKRLLLADDRLLQLDPTTLRTLAEIRLPGHTVGLAASPDNRMVAAVGAGVPGVVSLVDLAGGRIRELPLRFAGVAAAFAPDGRRLAVAGQGGEVQVLDVRTGAGRTAVVGHAGPATSIAFAADGATIVSGGRDGRMAVWDGHTGQLLGAVTVAGPDVATFPAFRPDGHTVVVVSTDGAVHAWDSDPRRWATDACRIAGRDVSPSEWVEAVGDRPYRPACRIA